MANAIRNILLINTSRIFCKILFVNFKKSVDFFILKWIIYLDNLGDGFYVVGLVFNINYC